MASGGGNGESTRKGSHNGKATGANIKIHSKGNLQVGPRPVLVKTSGTSVPNITTGNVSGGQNKASFLENAEVLISQDGGNVLIGDDSKVVLLGDREMSKDVMKRSTHVTNVTNRTSQSSQSEDEEMILNDLMANQLQTPVRSNIPLKEPLDGSKPTTGTAVASSLNQSKPSLYTDAVGLPPTAKGEVVHAQGNPENVEKQGARRKEPRSPKSSLDTDSHRRRSKSDQSNTQSKSASSAKSVQVQPHQQNIPHKSNIPGQMTKQVNSGRLLQEPEDTQNFQSSISPKNDQSNVTISNINITGNQSKPGSLNDDGIDLQSRIAVESKKAVTYPGNKELHFCVQERDEWVQIGDCCVIVELNIDDKLVDTIKQQGEFTAEINTGEVMVNLRWGDLQKNVKAYRSSLKVTVAQHFQNLEHKILQELFFQRCEKLIKTVRNIFEKCNSDARVVDITKGCFQFNFIHRTQESVDCLHSEQCVREIQIFLTDLLITDRIRGLAGTDGEILRVTSLKDQLRMVDGPEEMKKYGLLALERAVASTGLPVSQAELKPSEMRYKIQDLGNEVRHIKTTMRSQNERIQETMKNDNDALKSQLSDITDILRSLVPKINNLEERVTQISTESEIHLRTSRISRREETVEGTDTASDVVPSGPSGLSPVEETVEGIKAADNIILPVPTLRLNHDVMEDGRHRMLPSGYHSLESSQIDMSVEIHPRQDEELVVESDRQENRSNTPGPVISKTERDEVPGYSISVLMELLFGDRSITKDNPGDKTPGPTEGATAAVPDEENSDEAQGFLYHFEDFLKINDTLETIKLMMQEEDDESPRASGIDTVLCLDLSQSMEGDGLIQLKQVVNTYLDGVEENATERRLEENVAMVTFGESAIVQQNLTNDFNALREIVEELRIQGGCSSILEALILSVCLIVIKGKSVPVEGFNILPHIILITDGKLMSSTESLDEVTDFMEFKREMIISILLRIKQSGFNFPITCVPVGEFRDVLLQKLVTKTNGRMIPYEEANKLSRYNPIQRIVAKALKFLSEMDTEHSISVEDVIKNLIHLQQFDLSDRAYIEKIIQIYKKTQPNYLFFDDFYVEEYPELPPLGSRVKRKNKVSHFEGTIVSHLSESKVEVIWDSGDPKTYNLAKDDWDIIVIDKPRIMTSQDINPPIGTLVKRGVDWRYEDQDGGIGKVGAVINVEPLGLLRVCWPNGTKNFYRFGYEGCRDVLILDIYSHKLRSPVEGLDVEDDDGITVVDNPDIVVSWQWMDDAGTWWRYTKEQMRIIEEAYSDNQPTCVLGTEEHQKRLLLDRFEVRDVATGFINKINRKETKK